MLTEPQRSLRIPRTCVLENDDSYVENVLRERRHFKFCTGIFKRVRAWKNGHAALL